ncbi:MAG: glycoside hydrolase family 3 C-terminal domain-containing protein [Lachnospiraceae bacterium]|nr:glycoside hydrolase family 3 C-terminal domain-containing protein [Lachnospiraceae bacterium]
MVLLENRGALPVSPRRIALFGNGACRTVKGGIGSGDVNTRSNVYIEQGLENAGFTVTTKTWFDAQDTDTVIYVISHNSGEGADRYDEAGDYKLFGEELDNLKLDEVDGYRVTRGDLQYCVLNLLRVIV